MNKKGFTLIELIVTIALLAMISLISFVSINNAIQKSKDNECDNIRGTIKNAAKLYFSSNRYTSPEKKEVTAKELQEKGYLKKENIKNPYDKDKYLNLNSIKVTENGESLIVTMPNELNECKKYN